LLSYGPAFSPSFLFFFFFSSRRRHTRCLSDWSSDVCSSDLHGGLQPRVGAALRVVVEALHGDQHRRDEWRVAAVGHARGMRRPEIGRASCRERGEMTGGAGSVKKKGGGGR